MDKNIIEKYKTEMLKMSRSAIRTNAETNQDSEPETKTENIKEQNSPNSQGKLIAIVTTLRNLYPINNAKVTLFTGDYNNMNIIATNYTDQSGRTDAFVLETPLEELSLNSENTVRPYALYNMLVEAEGYLSNLHLNIPVFSNTTSLQRSNMLLVETAGVNKGPQIFDETQQFNL